MLALRRPTRVAAALLLGYLLCLVAVPADPFTWWARAVVVTGVALVLVVGMASRRRLPPPSPGSGARHPPSLAGWLSLLGGVAVLELHMYRSQPRHDYPTISSITNDLVEARPARALALLLWLVLGLLLVRR